MNAPSDLPKTIALFPLPGALLLPRARLPLHIFEPRYVAMLLDAMKTEERLIGMIQPMGQQEGPTGPRLHKVGCAGRVSQFSETEDGRYFITLTGVSRFRLQDEVEGFHPYRRAEVTWTGFERDRGREERDAGFRREAFLCDLQAFFEAKELSTDWETMKDADDELLINSLSMLLDFPPEDKQALLEAPTLTDRRETLVTLMAYAMRGGDEPGVMQ